jgi:rubrerythrin
MEYDDEAALTQYVWKHYLHLMTDFERQVGHAIHGRLKAEASRNPTIATMLNKNLGRVDDLAVDAALAQGAESFQKGVCQRVLTESGEQVSINRCPICHRVVRTPQARQCFWCGHDWHDPAKADISS